jgi:hypothetical protein
MFNFDFLKGQSSSISELLSTPNVSLMRLLDEETFLSEFRSANSQVNE